MSLYQRAIAILAPACDPRHVEAWMRLGQPNGCLDDLAPERFKSELDVAVCCIRNQPIEQSEDLARSYGL